MLAEYNLHKTMMLEVGSWRTAFFNAQEL